MACVSLALVVDVLVDGVTLDGVGLDDVALDDVALDDVALDDVALDCCLEGPVALMLACDGLFADDCTAVAELVLVVTLVYFNVNDPLHIGQTFGRSWSP